MARDVARTMALKLLSFVPVRVVKLASRAQWKSPAWQWIFQKLSRSLRKGSGVIQKGPGRGLNFEAANGVAGYLLGTYEIGIQQVFTELLRPGDVVFDVGTNCGFLTIIASRLVGPGGKVIGFEPGPEAMAAARHNVKSNKITNVELFEVALGDQDGEAQFYTSRESGWGRLQSSGPATEMQGEIAVHVQRLDSIAATLSKPQVIKVDIEGGETAMLRGGSRTISEMQPLLLIELHGTNKQVAEILEGFGYCSMILGTGSCDIRSAPSYSYVLAGPAQFRDTLERLSSTIKDVR